MGGLYSKCFGQDYYDDGIGDMLNNSEDDGGAAYGAKDLARELSN
jgi:hypothetical protein